MPYEKERVCVCVRARTALSDIMSSLLSLCLMIDVRAEREKRLSVESALGFARRPRTRRSLQSCPVALPPQSPLVCIVAINLSEA